MRWILLGFLLLSGGIEVFPGPELYYTKKGSPVRYRCFNCGVEEVEDNPVRRGDGTPLTYTCGKCWDNDEVGRMRPVENK